MDQKLLFNDALVSLVEYASAQGNQLTKEEIQNHFKELTLDNNQYELIYSYLAANKISVEGFDGTEENVFAEEPASTETEEAPEELGIPEETSPLKESQEELSFIDMYLKELEAIPPANADEKATLLQKLSEGNQDVINRLVELHLDMVAEAAQKKRGKGVTFGDLIQEGNMGLIQAISEFKEDLETFDAYLERAIDVALDQAINNQVSSDRIGQHLANKLNQLDKATKDLSEKLGRVPELSELAEEMGITEEETSLLLKTSLDTLSVNEDTQITEPEQTEPTPKKDPLTWRVNQ